MEINNEVSEVNRKMPLISVIVPAYNIEEYLSRCLDSILAQTYDKIEIILVDDGSTDKTGDIADSYQTQYSDKVKCIHCENGGVTQARLTGIAAASGEWIGFIDGDDAIERDMYERLMNNALKYHADISHCGYQTIVNNGERIHYFYNTGKIVQQDRVTGMKDLISGSFIEPSLCNKLFHRKLFRSLLYSGAMNSSIKFNEDLLMNYMLFREAEIAVYEDFCPYHYMARSTSATRLQFNEHKVLDPLKVCKWILEDVGSELQDIAWEKYLICCMGVYVSLHGRTGYQDKCKEVKDVLRANRDKWVLLNRKERMRLRMILLSPRMYNWIYHFYERNFQRKIYE